MRLFYELAPKTKKKGGLITEVKAGDQIIYQEPESEDWNKVTLTSRGYSLQINQFKQELLERKDGRRKLFRHWSEPRQG